MKWLKGFVTGIWTWMKSEEKLQYLTWSSLCNHDFNTIGMWEFAFVIPCWNNSMCIKVTQYSNATINHSLKAAVSGSLR